MKTKSIRGNSKLQSAADSEHTLIALAAPSSLAFFEHTDYDTHTRSPICPLPCVCVIYTTAVFTRREQLLFYTLALDGHYRDSEAHRAAREAHAAAAAMAAQSSGVSPNLVHLPAPVGDSAQLTSRQSQESSKASERASERASCYRTAC